MTQVLDGHTGIEHMIPVAPLYKDAVTLLARSQRRLHADVDRGLRWNLGRELLVSTLERLGERAVDALHSRGAIDERSRRRLMVAEDDFYHLDLAKTAKDVVRAGGRVQLGAHGQLQGLGAHWELWMLAQGGLTPLEAIAARLLPEPSISG
jgi:hypothetical protein